MQYEQQPWLRRFERVVHMATRMPEERAGHRISMRWMVLVATIAIVVAIVVIAMATGGGGGGGGTGGY
jgi:hypothetical protein